MSISRKDSGIELLVAERTRALTEANESLMRELADLRGSLERRALNFRLIVDSIPVPVAVTTPSGEVEGLNQATLDYFGRTLEDLQGWETSDAVHPEDLERTIAALHAAHQEGRTYNVETRHRRADGVYRWFNTVGLPLRDMDGRILRWLHLLIDIDDRHRAEDALRKSEACLAEAQTLSSTGSFVWNAGTDEHFWSEETFRIFECSRLERITTQLIENRAHREDLHVVKHSLVQAANLEDIDYECRFLMPSGTLKYLRIVAHPHEDISGRVQYVGAVQDVTKRRLADEELREGEQRYRDLQAQLAHANRIATIGQLTAWIAHDVRQPLVGIVASADAGIRWLSADPPNVAAAQRALDRVVREGHRAADVLDRIRALVKKAEPEREAVDMNAVVEETITLIRPECDRAGIAMQSDLAPALSLVLADRIQIQQVLMNLVVNAIQAMVSATAMKPHELRVTSAIDSSGFVLVSVSDSGPGISPEHKDRLFDAFFTTRSEGLGMGLAICRTIIESFGGRIWMTPNTPRGAAFHLALPRLANSPPNQREGV